MNEKRLRSLIGSLIGLLIFCVAIWNTSRTPEVRSSEPIYRSPVHGVVEVAQTNAWVEHVVDGDTLTVRLDADPATSVKVRLLGVNTPETVDPRRPVQCFGKQASAFAKSLLEGQRISLQADPEADEIDKYGRLLRNVYLADGTDVNAELVAQGYANAYVSFPQNAARKAELRQLEAQAKEAQIGLWDPQTCPSP